MKFYFPTGSGEKTTEEGAAESDATTVQVRRRIERSEKLKFFFSKPSEAETAETEIAESAARDASAPHRITPPTTFAEMHIRAGDRIPIETAEYASSGGKKGNSLVGKAIGWVEHGTLLVNIPGNVVHAGLIRENEQVLLRAFTGQNAFAFHSTIVKIVHVPYTYIHLTFPNQVQAVRVRSSVRHGVHLPITVTVAGGAEGVEGYMLNIGMNGALISLSKPLTDENMIRIILQFELYDAQASLELQAMVRSSKEAADEHGATWYEFGVEFQELQPSDRLTLGSLLWHEAHAHPERVV